VRFYGYYDSTFDANILRQIPAVKSLAIDSLKSADGLGALRELNEIEELSLGVHENLPADILALPNLVRLRKLTVGESRKKDIDLSPVARFPELETLTVLAQTKGLALLEKHPRLKQLRLYQIPKAFSLKFVSSLPSLKSLRVALGGRVTLSEASNSALGRLEVLRVRGLSGLDLEGFPSLVELYVEDQIQIHEIDLAPVRETIQAIEILNCKYLRSLPALESLPKLRQLILRKTSLDPDETIRRLPSTLGMADLSCYGVSRDKAIRAELDKLGFRGVP
jgi:hypothetical protein